MSDPIFFRNLLAHGIQQYERDQAIRGELGTAQLPLASYELTENLKHRTGAVSGLGGLLKVGGYTFHLFRARDRYVIDIWCAPDGVGIKIFKSPDEPLLAALPADLAVKLNSLPGAEKFIRANGYAGGLTNEEIQERQGVYRWHVDSMDGLCTWAAFIRDNIGNWRA